MNNLLDLNILAGDRRPFVARILAEPGDDAPQLVFADWMDEHDENGSLVRWWVQARRSWVPRISAVRQHVGTFDYDEHSKSLFDHCGPLPCVLAMIAMHHHNENRFPTPWDELAALNGFKRKMKVRNLEFWKWVELIGMGIIPASREILDFVYSNSQNAGFEVLDVGYVRRTPRCVRRRSLPNDELAHRVYYAHRRIDRLLELIRGDRDAVHAIGEFAITLNDTRHQSDRRIQPSVGQIAFAVLKCSQWLNAPTVG